MWLVHGGQHPLEGEQYHDRELAEDVSLRRPLDHRRGVERSLMNLSFCRPVYCVVLIVSVMPT